jgi:hypothetical protein
VKPHCLKEFSGGLSYLFVTLQRILNEFCSENVNFQEIGEGPMSKENMSFERARAGDLRAWLGAGGRKKS